MFRAIISPILWGTRLCLQLVVQNTDNAASWSQQAALSVLYTTNCKHSLVPEDERNYRPKHVELIEIINKIIIVASSRLFILTVWRQNYFFKFYHTLYIKCE